MSRVALLSDCENRLTGRMSPLGFDYDLAGHGSGWYVGRHLTVGVHHNLGRRYSAKLTLVVCLSPVPIIMTWVPTDRWAD